MWKLYNIGMKQSKIIDTMEMYQPPAEVCEGILDVEGFMAMEPFF